MGKQLARDLAYVFDEIRKELFLGMLESDVRRLSRMMARLQKNAIGIRSAQKCDKVRQRRRIGGHETKSEIPQPSHPPLAANILTSSPQRARIHRACD